MTGRGHSYCTAWTACVYQHSGGRPEKLTPSQKKRLVELIEAGPLVVGCETACWNSVLIRVLIWREFGVLFNRHYVCTLLHNLGFSFQKACFVSDHLDATKRLVVAAGQVADDFTGGQAVQRPDPV